MLLYNHVTVTCPHQSISQNGDYGKSSSCRICSSYWFIHAAPANIERNVIRGSKECFYGIIISTLASYNVRVVIIKYLGLLYLCYCYKRPSPNAQLTFFLWNFKHLAVKILYVHGNNTIKFSVKSKEVHRLVSECLN